MLSQHPNENSEDMSMTITQAKKKQGDCFIVLSLLKTYISFSLINENNICCMILL